ncbi:hypothetical protein ACIA5D_49710 [Actinoplanes sp. NPDC051513]|uniref:hypothetical protein n=1 Tax=Actinoplanes sp. NPDC051513 TaxID=3363908 RepID=UPI0037A11DFC
MEPIDADWSSRVPPDLTPAPEYTSNFSLSQALKSMHLSNNLSDDTLLHALEPMLWQMPNTVTTFVRHPESPARESVARSLVRLWLKSSMAAKPPELTAAPGPPAAGP